MVSSLPVLSQTEKIDRSGLEVWGGQSFLTDYNKKRAVLKTGTARFSQLKAISANSQKGTARPQQKKKQKSSASLVSRTPGER